MYVWQLEQFIEDNSDKPNDSYEKLAYLKELRESHLEKIKESEKTIQLIEDLVKNIESPGMQGIILCSGHEMHERIESRYYLKNKPIIDKMEKIKEEIHQNLFKNLEVNKMQIIKKDGN